MNKNKYSWLGILFFCHVYSAVFANDCQNILNSADSLREIKQYDKAIEKYLEVANVQQKAYNWDEYISTNIEVMLVYFEMDSLKKAIKFSERLVKEAEDKLPEDNLTLGLFYHKKGVLHFYNAEDNLSIRYYKKALAIRMKNEGENTEDIIRGYRNIGDAYYFLGKVDSAKYNLEIAFGLIQEKPPADKSLELGIYQLLARVYRVYGDLSKAEEFLIYRINTYNKNELNEIEKVEKAIILGDYGEVLRNLHRFQDAIKSFKEGINLIEKGTTKDKSAKADLLSNLGICYLEKGDYKLGLQALNKSLKLNQAIDRKQAIQANYLNICTLKNKLDKPKEALDIIEKSIFLESLVNKDFVSRVYDNQGDAYIKLGKIKRGIEYYNQSLQQLTKNYIPKNILENPDISSIDFSRKGILVTLSSKAKAFNLLYETEKESEYLNASFLTYQKIDTLISKIRQNFLAENSKLSLVEETKLIYEKAIEVSLDLYKLSKEEKYKNAAFDFIQKSKAITLSEAVRHTQSTSFLDVDLSKEKQLNININRFIEKSYTSEGLSVEEEQQLINLKINKEKFIKNLEQNNHAYFDYKYNGKTVSSSEVNFLLDEETALVEFFIGEKACFVLTYTIEDKLRINKIPITKEVLTELIRKFNKSIYNPFISKKEIDEISLESADIIYREVALELYNLLLKPLKITMYSKLVIIPDDILNTLSFDALLTQKVPMESIGYYGNKNDYSYLLYQHEISYNYGISLIKQSKVHHSTSRSLENQLIVYNTPDFRGQVEELKKIFGNRNDFIKTMRNKGTKQSFQEKAGSYKYIHLSVHGILNNEDPNQSYFKMNTSENEGFEPLYLSTLYNLSINSEMVVTSACDAGIGKISKGEGILSLARGFFYAGAKSVITSLWEIKDGYTGRLLKNFYQNLKEGKDKREALNQAKQTFIETQGDDFARPYYWAAFVPIGEMESVEIPYILPFGVKITMGFIVSILIIVLLKYLLYNHKSPTVI